MLKRFLGGNSGREWELIGNNRNVARIPRWVMSAFSGMPGSHGTLLIEYPEPGQCLHFKGKTYRYRIDMGDQVWEVYRRKRRG